MFTTCGESVRSCRNRTTGTEMQGLPQPWGASILACITLVLAWGRASARLRRPFSAAPDELLSGQGRILRRPAATFPRSAPD